MPTWQEFEDGLSPESIAALKALAKQLGGQPNALSLAKSLVGHMRRKNWSYCPNMEELAHSLRYKRINCDKLAALLIFLYAYYNHDTPLPNVTAEPTDVHGPNKPVFLPQTKIRRAGLVIEMNVQGSLSGLFFSDGHRVATLNNECYDLISGNKGSKANMLAAYCSCDKVLAASPAQYQFHYLGSSRYLTHQLNKWTRQGLAKFTCT